jgi:hypothetical protein
MAQKSATAPFCAAESDIFEVRRRLGRPRNAARVTSGVRECVRAGARL